MEKNNLELWNKVEMTNPAHTKDSSFGRKITAIDAYQQIKNFTEQFGPCGVGWGYHSDIVGGDTFGVCVVKIVLWIKGEGQLTEFGTCEWMPKSRNNPNGKLDSDAPKKANTDGLTKAFSRLGFNADIFLGKFEDNKYIQEAANEKGREEATKEQAAINVKNLKLINGRFSGLKDAAELVDMVAKMEMHFGPLYGCEVGKFFNNPYFAEPVIKKCKELGIDSKEIING